MKDLPHWLKKYQKTNSSINYLQGNWSMKNSFNYNLDSLFSSEGGGTIKSIPFGNTILKPYNNM